MSKHKLLPTSVVMIPLIVFQSAPARAQAQGTATSQVQGNITTPPSGCGPLTPPSPASADPAKYVRVYEQSGKGTPRLIYFDRCSSLKSTLLKADSESTLIIDVSEMFANKDNADMALNKLFMLGNLKKSNAATDVEVTNYSKIGKEAGIEKSQKAFAFQTFDNIGAKVVNLYFTSRELIEGGFGATGQTCYALLSKLVSPALAGAGGPTVATACPINATTRGLFEARLRTYAVELQELSTFFSGEANRLVNAKIATDVFEIDIESLQGIAKQVATQWELAQSTSVTPAGKDQSLDIIIERIMNTVEKLSGLIGTTRALSLDPSVGATICPGAYAKYSEAPKLPLPVPPSPTSSSNAFARTCVIEYKRKDYLKRLENDVMQGSISLSENNASSGDVLTLTVEAKGSDEAASGNQVKFRVRVTDFGWKGGVEPSLFFIKRIGVNEADANRPLGDPVRGLQPVRFAPFPGVNLTASHHGGRTGFQEFLHVLAPGFGLNTTFMTFGAQRDFDPTIGDKGQFVTTNGSNFQIGTGPVVTLFGNRISATYGWNLMANERRAYFGFGFGFLSLGRDLVGLIKKN